MKVWGWTRYERTYRERADGRKKYIGWFRQDNDPMCWTIVRVPFWARQPRIALRDICRSGRDPIEFYEKDVN